MVLWAERSGGRQAVGPDDEELDLKAGISSYRGFCGLPTEMSKIARKSRRRVCDPHLRHTCSCLHVHRLVVVYMC